MAEAVATPEELNISRELAREKLQTLKAGRRSRAEVDYFGQTGRPDSVALGRSFVNDEPGAPPEAIENSRTFKQFRENMPERARRYGQIMALRATKQRNLTAAQAARVEQQAVSAFAKQAYTRIWQMTEEGIEDFALSFMDLMIFSGPAVIMMFLVRLFGGNLFGGSGTVSFREITVPRIPGYGAAEGFYRVGKVLFIGLITGLIYTLFFFIVTFIAHPELIAKMALCPMFNPILSFVGIDTCTNS